MPLTREAMKRPTPSGYVMEARTTAARAEYKGLLWGKGSCSLPPFLPHSLGVHTEERGTEKEEKLQQGNYQVPPTPLKKELK